MADISEINIDDTSYNIKDAQNRQDLTTLSTEVQSISTNLNSLSISISTNYLPLSGGTLTGQLNINSDGSFINLIANNVDATTTPDSNKYENIMFSDKNNLRLSGIETTYRTNNSADIKLIAYNQNSDSSNYFLIGRTAEGENTYSMASPDNFRDAINAVNKSGDTMTGVLIVSDHNIKVKKTNADISASTINQSQYAIVGATDKNDRYIGYMQASNDTSGATSIQLSSRKYINNSDVENFVRLLVYASGDKGVVVSDAEAWRNALGASNGIWPISIGGTGGADSGWQSYKNSNVFTGTIYYRKIGAFFEIQAQQINVKNTINAGSYVVLMTLPSTYRLSKEIYPTCFINADAVNNRVVSMRLAGGGNLYLYANKTDEIKSSYNLYFSGFGFM